MAGMFAGGLGMAMSGIAVAIPLVMFGGKALINLIGDGAEAAKKATEEAARLSKIGNKMLEDDLEKRVAAIDREAETTAKLGQKWENSIKAADEYTTAVLSNAEKYELSQRKIAEALGLKSDKMREIDAMEKIQEAKLQAKAQLDLEAEGRKVQDAKKLLEQANDHLTNMEFEAARQLGQRNKLEAQLKALHAEADALRTASHETSDPFLQRPDPKFIEIPYVTSTKAADKAKARLNGPVASQIADLQAQLTTVWASVDKMQGDAGALAKLETTAKQASDKVEDVSRAYEIKAQTIAASLEESQIDLKATNALDRGKALAEEIKGMVATIGKSDEITKTATKALSEDIASGTVTADKLPAIAQELRAIFQQHQLGFNTMNDSIGNHSEVMAKINRDLAAQKQITDRLRSQVGMP